MTQDLKKIKEKMVKKIIQPIQNTETHELKTKHEYKISILKQHEFKRSFLLYKTAVDRTGHTAGGHKMAL